MKKYLCKKQVDIGSKWYLWEVALCSAVYWSFRLNWFKHHVDFWKCIFSLPLHLLQDVGPTPSWSLIDHPRCKPVKARSTASKGATCRPLNRNPPVDALSSNSSLVSPRAPGSNFKCFCVKMCYSDTQNVWKQKDLEIFVLKPCLWSCLNRHSELDSYPEVSGQSLGGPLSTTFPSRMQIMRCAWRMVPVAQVLEWRFGG